MKKSINKSSKKVSKMLPSKINKKLESSWKYVLSCNKISSLSSLSVQKLKMLPVLYNNVQNNWRQKSLNSIQVETLNSNTNKWSNNHKNLDSSNYKRSIRSNSNNNANRRKFVNLLSKRCKDRCAKYHKMINVYKRYKK